MANPPFFRNFCMSFLGGGLLLKLRYHDKHRSLLFQWPHGPSMAVVHFSILRVSSMLPELFDFTVLLNRNGNRASNEAHGHACYTGLNWQEAGIHSRRCTPAKKNTHMSPGIQGLRCFAFVNGGCSSTLSQISLWTQETVVPHISEWSGTYHTRRWRLWTYISCHCSTTSVEARRGPKTTPRKPDEVQKRSAGRQRRSKNIQKREEADRRQSESKRRPTEDQGSPQIWLQEQARGRQRKTKNKVFTPRHGRNTQGHHAIKAAKNALSNSTSTFSSCRCQARTPGLGYGSCCLAGFSHRMSSIQHPNRTRRLLRSTLKALWRTSLFDSSPGTK